MDWNPADHPRDPHSGEFIDRPGGGWATAVLDQLGGIPTYRSRSQFDPQEARRFQEVIKETLRVNHEGPMPRDRTPEQQHADYLRNMELTHLAVELASQDQGSDKDRLHQEAQHEYYRDWYRRRNHPDLTVEQMHELMAQKAKQAFAGRQVATRVTPAGLSKILEDGRFRTVFDPAIRSRGLNNTDARARYEQMTWGYGWDTDPSLRPVYGYLAGPVRHAAKDSFDEALSQYGRIEVRLKDSAVRHRTTAMFGDSLDMRHSGRPSQVDNPEGWAWTYANPHGLLTNRLSTTDRPSPDDPAFLGSSGYIEAQVHGGVTVGDIESVVFPSAPSAALKQALAQAGIPWQVVKA